ncbi:MAG: topoisomerase DNA-binding C4 zinc finger domain-containing protein [Methanomassiliicoccaceae archaeon]|nr:topoisomerase DNA-binding C4 zinc finger domain-containing protein [Methanomassiliicoccaceae archaeon]
MQSLSIKVDGRSKCHTREIKANPPITKEEHIQSIHRTEYETANKICPRCGKSLVLRNGRNGQFYGCKGYPDCHFTKNLK